MLPLFSGVYSGTRETTKVCHFIRSVFILSRRRFSSNAGRKGQRGVKTWIICKTAPILAAVFLTGGAFVFGEVTAAAPGSPQDGLTLADVQLRRDSAASQQGLQETLRTSIIEQYDEALRQLKLADEWRRKAAHFEQLRIRAPQETKALQEYLANPPEEAPIEIPETATLLELEQMLAGQDTQHRSLQAELEQFIKEPERRADRRAEIANLAAAAQQRIQETQSQLNAPPALDEPPDVAAARRIAVLARLQALQQEIAAYDKETQSYDARSTLIALLQDNTKRRLIPAARDLKTLQEAVAEARRKEARAAAEEARAKEISVDAPYIRDRARQLLDENAALAERRTGMDGLTGKIETQSAKLAAEDAQLKQLQEEYDRIIQRVKAGGLNSAIGVMLRKQKSQLPNIRQLKREIRERRTDIGEVQLVQSDLREQRLRLSDVEEDLRSAIEQLPKAPAEKLSNARLERRSYTDQERDAIRKEIAGIIQNQRGLIDALQRDYDSYLNILFDLTAKQGQLIDQTNRFANYINENILWIGGTSPPGLKTFKEGKDALRWLLSPKAWSTAPGLLRDDLLRNPEIYVLLLLMWTGWFALRRRALVRIRFLGGEAAKKRNTRFAHTLEVLILTVFVTGLWSAIVAGITWRLMTAVEIVDQARAAGAGILAAAFVGFCLALLRQMMMDDGLAEAHFGWPRNRLRSARRVLAFLALAALPAVFVIFTYENQREEFWKDSVGRVAFVAAMAAAAVALYRLLHLAHEGLHEMPRTTWVARRERLHWPIHLLLAGLPVGLAMLSMAGFHFTALHLAYRVFWTLLLILSVMIIVNLVRRWLLLTRRALAIEQARRRRVAMKAEGPSEAELSDTELDIVRIDAQTQRLVRSLAGIAILLGVWLIWVDVIPALNALDNIRLWNITISVEEQVQDPTGKTEVVMRQRLKGITASNVILALMTVVVTFLAVRHLPALIEIILLQRLQMGAGERYATLAIVRYILVGFGIIFAFNAIGIGWSNVQWLVAALGVGLGFGLQEIFANFVSGLILLFERPIRVGDVVTIGSVSGTVSQIRIRATTITDWDRKELVVPNKEFVTGQLVNWTLSDDVLRVVVPVGIAYGSNTDLAIKTLERIVREHPLVLDDPAPQVLFLAFGDSSLNFEVRAFLSGVASRLTVLHDLNMAIDKAFREAGIEISFPQRDLHIRSGLEPLTDALRKRQEPPPPA